MKLVIGNKNYSSWSMRPWVLMRHFDIAFDEVLLRFDFAPGSAFYRELARETIAQWRRDNNEVRLHSSIGRIPPARFAEQHRRQPTRSRNLQPRDSFRNTGTAERGWSEERLRAGRSGRSVTAVSVLCSAPTSHGTSRRSAKHDAAAR